MQACRPAGLLHRNPAPSSRKECASRKHVQSNQFQEVGMNKKVLAALLLLLPTIAWAESQWVLEGCTLTYHVSHPLHQTEGVSHAARGKGVCHGGQCDLLIAVPVKSFDSGDSNRDIHMVQVTRGAAFPMVTVRTRLPEAVAGSAMVQADLEIHFAGQTVQYK